MNLFINFPGAEEKINLNEWIYKPGLPTNCPTIVSSKFIEVDREYQKWTDGAAAISLRTANWATQQWINFIDKIPSVITFERLEELDKTFNLSKTGNAEIADAWFLQSLIHNYSPAYIYMEKFLIEVGRRKFLMPLYKEMMKTTNGKNLATKIYSQARPNYHFVARQSVDEILKWKN